MTDESVWRPLDSSVREVVTAFLRAENERDWDRYRSLLADDVEWTLMRPSPRVVHGAEEYMSTIQSFYEKDPKASFQIVQVVVDEEQGVAFAELDMAGRRSVDVFAVRGGRIALEREYFGY